MYGGNTKYQIAIPIHRVLPYPVIYGTSVLNLLFTNSVLFLEMHEKDT